MKPRYLTKEGRCIVILVLSVVALLAIRGLVYWIWGV